MATSIVTNADAMDKVNAQVSIWTGSKWLELANQKTVNTINSNITSISDAVTEAQAGITTASSNADTAMTTANNALSNAQTAISNAQTASDTANDATTVANNAISQAVSASTVANNISEEITTLKGGSTATIAKLEDGLALKLSTSDFDTQIANYATQTWTTNQITATATSLSSTIASVQTQVNNSAVGKNILTGTGEAFVQDSATTPVNYIDMYGDLKISFTNSGTGIVLTAGEKYTLSYDYAIDDFDNSKITGIGFGLGNGKNVGSYDEDTYAIAQAYTASTGTIKFTFTATSSTSNKYLAFRPMLWDNGVLFAYSKDDRPIIHISKLKLEKGDHATDWLANPADNATVTSVSNLTQTVNLLSTTVSGKVDTATYTSKITELASSIATKVSQNDYNTEITQLSTAIDAKVSSDDYNTEVTLLSNQISAKVSQSDYDSEITQLSKDINLKVSQGDVISQINEEADNILIKTSKLYLDASSVVFGGTAYITEAMISSVNADTITTGVAVGNKMKLDFTNGTMNVNDNFKVDSVGSLTATSANISGKITGSTITGSTISGSTLTTNADDAGYSISLSGTQIYNGANSITFTANSHAGVSGLLLKSNYEIGLTATDDLALNSTSGNIAAEVSSSNTIGFTVPNSAGVYLKTNKTIDLRTNGGNVNVNGAGLVVNGMANITGWLGAGSLSVSGSKNSVIPTSTGYRDINAYETAEYYFGDMAKANTGLESKVKVVMDSIFLETVNTGVGYHVFLSSYGNGYAWVSEQSDAYFVIKSNVPNLSLSYEVKAKRKGYENVRLEIDENFSKNVA